MIGFGISTVKYDANHPLSFVIHTNPFDSDTPSSTLPPSTKKTTISGWQLLQRLQLEEITKVAMLR
jgi:hypothetical protein